MAKERYNGKLLVEGKDDQHVFWAMCEQHNVAESFDVIDCDGINNLKDLIPLRLKQQTVKILGIVVDADQDSNVIWNSLKHILRESNYFLPEYPVYGGYTHPPQGIYPKLGIWIMPENTTAGMLEDFARNLIPDTNPLKGYVDTVLQQLEILNYNRYSVIHRAKAYIHTFLAWQEDPGTPIGLSITKHYFDHDAAGGVNLIEWLNRLFNEQVN